MLEFVSHLHPSNIHFWKPIFREDLLLHWQYSKLFSAARYADFSVLVKYEDHSEQGSRLSKSLFNYAICLAVCTWPWWLLLVSGIESMIWSACSLIYQQKFRLQKPRSIGKGRDTRQMAQLTRTNGARRSEADIDYTLIWNWRMLTGVFSRSLNARPRDCIDNANNMIPGVSHIYRHLLQEHCMSGLKKTGVWSERIMMLTSTARKCCTVSQKLRFVSNCIRRVFEW